MMTTHYEALAEGVAGAPEQRTLTGRCCFRGLCLLVRGVVCMALMMVLSLKGCA